MQVVDTVGLAWEAQKEKKDNTGEVALAPVSLAPKEKRGRGKETSLDKARKQLGEHYMETPL